MELNASTIEAIVKKIVSEMDVPAKEDDLTIPVGISNRHIHLSREDLDTLFGKGYELTPIKDLSQPGQYACKEQLTIIGPSMRPIEGVRVLGPIRKESQVEISVTDSFVLKVKPPVRESGSLQGSAPIRIPTLKGALETSFGFGETRRCLQKALPSPCQAEETFQGCLEIAVICQERLDSSLVTLGCLPVSPLRYFCPLER